MLSLQRYFIVSVLLLAFSSRSQAQLNIIPQPVQATVSSTGSFGLTRDTRIIAGHPSLQPSADFLNEYLKQYYQFQTTTGKGSNRIELRLQPVKGDQPDSYHLQATANRILIQGNSAAGVFYGVQSLIQLLPVTPAASLNIPLATIYDYPRFSYRGLHLDVSRHFFPVSFVKQYIDYIALHKMNYFHWHLTDDQGWRIEIRKYPLLTRTGGFRNGTIIGHHPGTGNDNTPYGGYYTQEEIKEVVRYAAARYITVVPEIELPGHASAAIAAYPQLSCFPDSATVIDGPVSNAGNQQQRKKVQETWGVFEDVFCPSEYTFHFMEDVLDEVIALFPSKLIHIGGDECPKEAWKKSAYCQEMIRKLNLKDEHGLQSYFIGRIEKYLNSKGRNIIGWDEILEGGLAPNATVMSWRGEQGGIAAAKARHHVIMTPGGYMYFDHAQKKKDDSLTIGGYTTVEKVYSYDPVPKELNSTEAAYILGGQANMWTEYQTNTRKIQYQLFPRIGALSEVLWSQKESRSWSQFEERLRTQLMRYGLWGVACSDAPLTTETK